MKLDLWKLGLMNVAESDINDLFNYYDVDNSGGIDVNEFIEKIMPKDFTDDNGVIDLPCTNTLKGELGYGIFPMSGEATNGEK